MRQIISAKHLTRLPIHGIAVRAFSKNYWTAYDAVLNILTKKRVSLLINNRNMQLNRSEIINHFIIATGRKRKKKERKKKK